MAYLEGEIIWNKTVIPHIVFCRRLKNISHLLKVKTFCCNSAQPLIDYFVRLTVFTTMLCWVFLPRAQGVGWVSGKVHSEHIVATKVLMPMGGGVSGKVHSEHILATKVLMLIGGGCLGKCTLSTLLLQKCSCPWGGGVGLGVRESAL